MILCFDLDGTLCTLTQNSQYETATPFKDVIRRVNKLYSEGHHIKIFTARGCVSKKDWTQQTIKQLNEWGVQYHELIMNSKPHFDLLVDDKVMHIKDWRTQQKIKVGFLYGSLQTITPKIIDELKSVKEASDYLIFALNETSSSKDIKTILGAIKYVDEIIDYNTESEIVDKVQALKSNGHELYFMGETGKYD